MVRTTVICIVEGQTENAVLKHLVVPHLAWRGIDLHVPIKGRSDFAHGPRIAGRLNLATVRDRCPRFDEWLSRLEALAGP